MIKSKSGLGLPDTLRAGPTLLLSLLLVGSISKGVAAETNDWSFNVTPYLWVAGVEVNTSLPSAPPSTPPEAARFETRLSGGALLSATVRYKSVGLWVDFAWLRLATEASNPGPGFSSVDLKTDFIHSTAALTYKLPLQGKFHADVLAGARLWFVNEEITATGNVLPSFTSSGDNTWVDPIIGADLQYELTPKWSLVTKGTVGVTSSPGWEVMSGVSYRCSELCSIAFGYRYLHEDYSKGRFTLNTDMHGFILGVGFHF